MPAPPPQGSEGVGKPRPAGGRFTLPLLLLALSTLFLCSLDKGYFYRPANLLATFSSSLTIAENLSPDHNFLLFRGLHPGPDGAPTYEAYSRFPVGGYALIKLAILPFGNDLSAKILAARMLMLLLFSAAALLAFHALARITSHRWVALAATLMAFSSYYMLYYSDKVSVECSVDVFAVMLVFHGMVVFVQEGRFRQLAAGTCVALLLGWRVYAFLLPFILLGLAREAMGAWKEGSAVWPRLRSAAAAALWSRYTALGVFALLFGAAVLCFNFANEYTAFGGERAVAELPSFQSMLRRTGVDQDFAPVGWWLGFLRQQFFRACVASVPFMLSDWGPRLLGFSPSLDLSAPGVLAALLVVTASAVLVRLAWPLLAWRQRLLLTALALSGFFWTLPMRYSAQDHNQEALFYVGVPLAFYSLLLLYVHKRRGDRPVVGLAVAALLAFVVSTFQMDYRWGPDARAAGTQRAVLAELGAIRETTHGKAVLVLEPVEPDWSMNITWPFFGWAYYLAGSLLIHSPDVEAAVRAADFIVSHDRVESGALLTPGNERIFLYGSEGIDDFLELYRGVYQQAVSGDPAARSHFDVYLGHDTLTYVRDPCAREDVRPRWWIPVEVVPEDAERLPGRHKQYGSDEHAMLLRTYSVRFEGKCIAVAPLPDYPVSRIRTGQEWHRPRRGAVEWAVELDP